MTYRPILFSAPMVRAILAGRKTQTRRLLKNPEYYGCPTGDCPHDTNAECIAAMNANVERRYCEVGDRLWVREAWAKVPASAYRMSEGVQQTVCPDDPYYAAIYAAGWERCAPKWKPSIHMPRWASRITLEVTDVRIERLREITESDALAEGAFDPSIGEIAWAEPMGLARHICPAVNAFAALWADIHGWASWRENPWVCAISFERVTS